MLCGREAEDQRTGADLYQKAEGRRRLDGRGGCGAERGACVAVWGQWAVGGQLTVGQLQGQWQLGTPQLGPLTGVSNDIVLTVQDDYLYACLLASHLPTCVA